MICEECEQHVTLDLLCIDGKCLSCHEDSCKLCIKYNSYKKEQQQHWKDVIAMNHLKDLEIMTNIMENNMEKNDTD